MAGFKKIELGNLDGVSRRENGKVFLHDALGLTSAEVSINCVQRGFKVPFKHKHRRNEELYIFLKGEGALTIDDERVNVKEGSCVKILPSASRMLENTGSGDLQFICVQAREHSLEEFSLADAELY